MILKRRFPPHLHKKNMTPRVLKSKNFIYDLVEDTETQKTSANVKLVLTASVEGIGNRGDVVMVRPHMAYEKLLLPGLAVYYTPANEKKYDTPMADTPQVKYSSPHVARTLGVLGRRVFSLPMNKNNPWVVEPWHVRAAMRRASIMVLNDSQIEMPAKAITGPNLDIENHEFFVTVTINNCEKVKVRCRIHHWSTKLEDRLPWTFEPWNEPAVPLFPEDATDATPVTQVADTSGNTQPTQ